MSITSTSRFFHVSEVSVFCCLTNSIRPEGCREYMHRSLSLGSGRDGSCGGANISKTDNAGKKSPKMGKKCLPWGNPHSAEILTRSPFKKCFFTSIPTKSDLTSPASTCIPKSPIYLIDHVKKDWGEKFLIMIYPTCQIGIFMSDFTSIFWSNPINSKRTR